mmetsp:Transcript_9192/g.25775  ORF Transcript_9192/g.25775 Transcript_9192/m.25775 type:complete len:161 (+) Transcript_9192:200-682(+)|eukprot:CAMPEP_0119121566 /NCGR_PEP_ID=MMETSP1310-20130426/2137_1 /TAXON_ID=464262 /ORGANISM="Genus nov. species nov., Strain RCC2339" /LENGTH=160 /DNA_ID=CAMNT_0007111137 /DNA_START=197 /DNA_END=679 /DNA_ORIENTATION=-
MSLATPRGGGKKERTANSGSAVATGSPRFPARKVPPGMGAGGGSPEVRPQPKKPSTSPLPPPKPADAPKVPPKPRVQLMDKAETCELCGKPKLPITEDELMYAAIMPITYRCFTCGFMSKLFQPMEAHRKQTEHFKIGVAHSDLGEVRCGYCKGLLDSEG